MERIPKVILLIETSRAFGRSLLYGIVRYARSHGPWAFYRETSGLEHTLKYLKDQKADGIILRSPTQSHEITHLGIPAIYVIHRQLEAGDFHEVGTDGTLIGHMAAEHFLERGFQHFAYSGFSDRDWSIQRGIYFVERIGREGYPVSCHKVSETRMKRYFQQEQSRLAEWIQSLPKPLALMACNDDHGQHVLDACKLAGILVPEEVSVLGVDNDELVCNLSDPPMSSIALNTEQAGYQAGEVLDRLMKGEKLPPQKIMVQSSRVVARQSTDFLSVDDADLAAALRFIWQNARQPIGVSEVASGVAISRRVLEKKFQKILHRSIYRELRRVRVNTIISMLMETDSTISVIARKMGFPGIEHIARYFRKETGVSLRDYRKTFGQRFSRSDSDAAIPFVSHKPSLSKDLEAF
jgi:LacI family transcriptional regulator